MAGTLHTTPWNFAPYGTLGSIAAVPNAPFGGVSSGVGTWSSPVPYVLQQLQHVQQVQYVQQQQVQQLLQVLQAVPQQIQQVLQLIQFLPQQVAQLVQQALTQPSIGIPSSGIAGLGQALSYGGLSIAPPLQSAGFGASFPSAPTMTGSPFAVGQPGQVM